MILFIYKGLKKDSNNNTNSPYKFSGFYFDTYIEITIYDNCNDNIVQGLEDICKKYDNLFSPSIESSDIFKINSEKKDVTISEDTAYLLSQALIFSDKTNGIIDPSINSVYVLWTFSNELADKNNPLPSNDDIKNALATVDYRNIKVDKNTVSIGEDQTINLGFIAKGYITDQIKEYLLSQGIDNALINLGGNVDCIGSPEGKDSYIIGIEKPFDSSEYYCTLMIKDKSVVTSGIYERYLYYNGKYYHHILDKNNGYPIDNNIYSVTVIGDSSTICDGLSTTLFALGTKEGLKFLKDNYPGYECMYILDDYSPVYSSGFEDYLYNEFF